jgi:two-component system cell cycle response regulator DivK
LSAARGRSAQAPHEPLVLVVDDYEDARSAYVAALSDAGYRVEEAGNGKIALDRIAKNVPAIVLMNLSMPVLDGWEATRRIKADPTTAHVIVVAVTGHASPQAHERALAAGADAILIKTFTQGELLERVDELLASRPTSGVVTQTA